MCEEIAGSMTEGVAISCQGEFNEIHNRRVHTSSLEAHLNVT